ncbi:Nucleotide-binding universal stress protein, UspA family [Flavobacteriaceae bacterium MAR_2010_188]|nr:Nucleotide-binding universal stress protein, UspA family [Flavobacteriaceae bacterium MAR_2010_188]
MTTILVPVDFSEYSEHALKVAASIAKNNSAEIVAVHMMGMNLAALTKENSPDIEGLFFVNISQKRFKEFLNKDYLNGITVKHMVRNYINFSELDEVAIEHNADLIVMGSHGSSGLSEFFVESNTEKVVRSSATPVLVVKNSKSWPAEKVVFASDYKDESLSAFTKAMKIFDELNIEVELVFINRSDESFLRTEEIDSRILNFLVKLPGQDFIPEDVTVYSDYTVEAGIFSYAKKIKADMIGLSTHGRQGLAHFFSGSIGEDLVNHSSLPVLTIRM